MPPVRPRLHGACFLPSLCKPRLATANLPRLVSSEGARPDDHALNRKDELDVQSKAVRSGQRERAGASEPTSSATIEKDPGNQNKEAHKDHPEAPGPVLGMNDERGGVSKGKPMIDALWLMKGRRDIRDKDGDLQLPNR